MKSENETIKEIATLLHKESNYDFDCDGDCDNCWCAEKTTARKLYELGYRKMEDSQ